MAPNRIYTDAMIAFIHRYKATTPPAEFHLRFNQHFNTHMTQKALDQTGRRYGVIYHGPTTKFKTGMTPWNKNTKGLTTPNSKSFKKGERRTTRPIGYEFIDKDGYTQIKVADEPYKKNNRYKHRVVYESIHGPIPKGYVVIFIDSDRRNCSPDNLIAISRQQLAILNKHEKFSEQPIEIRRALITLVQLNMTNKALQNQPGTKNATTKHL